MGDADDEGEDDEGSTDGHDDFENDNSNGIAQKIADLERRNRQTNEKLDRLMNLIQGTLQNNRLSNLAPHPHPATGSLPPVAISQRAVVTKPRPQADLILQRAVRKHWAKLMEGWAPAAEGMVASYRLEQGPACTETSFVPDFVAKCKSDWNISVVEVFTASFLASGDPVIPAESDDNFKYAVMKAAGSRLKSWRKAAKLKTLPADVQRGHRKKKRHSERKRNMFLRRFNAAVTHEECHPHLPILDALGPAGMSSDDSDHTDEAGVPQYRIKSRPWRNPELTPFLRVLDGVHRHDRFQDTSEDRTAGAGAQPHIRNMLPGPLAESTTRPPVGLPRPVYRSELLDTPQGARLRARTSAPHNFTHAPAIVKYVYFPDSDERV